VNDHAEHVVLVWHDRGQSPAEAEARIGSVAGTIMAPEWDPDADDGGRTDLLTSVRTARDLLAERGGDPDTLTVCGIGLGAVAAASLGTHAKRLGIALGDVICIEPTWEQPDPISGRLLKPASGGNSLG
jgi:hypothetical protein